MTLRLFDSQDYSTLDVIPSMCTENNTIENYDYLRECITNLENKNSDISLSAVSTNIPTIGLEENSLDHADLNNIDFNCIKIGNLLSQTVEEHGNYTKDKLIKQKKLTYTEISELIQNLDTASSCYDTNISDFSNNSNKELSIKPHSNVQITISNNKPHIFNKNKIINHPVVKEIVKSHSSIVKSQIKNNERNVDPSDEVMNIRNNCNQSISSRSKYEIKIANLEVLDRDDQTNKTCEQCLMTFKYKRHLDRHLEGHQKNNCPHCNEKFARRKHLEVHLFRTHGERIIRHFHLCDVCPKSFPKRTLLNRHRAKHSYQSGKVCSDCGDMINENTDHKEHKESYCSRKQFECKQCSQRFSIEQTYLLHIQNHNNYKCPNCDVSFASKKKAHEHFKAVHSLKSADQEIMSNGPYFCTSCRHTFAKKDDYFRHLASALHHNKINRDLPIRSIFSCTICAKKLITQRALDQHIRRIHKGEKRFTCNIYGCTFQCTRKTDLNRHKHLHVEERNIVCEHCGKTFTSVSILKDHVLYIHNKERQFICEECGKAFKRNSLLKRHKLSHEQHRPFACTQCNTAFKRSHHLTRHMESCHRIRLEKRRKVVKFMKAEDGHLVPVPEKPKGLETSKIKTEHSVAHQIITKEKEKNYSTATNQQLIDVNLEPQNQSLPSSEENTGCSNLLEFTKLPVNESIPQVFSLIDISTGQVLTLEVTNTELLSTNEITDQYEENYNEILNLPNYMDIEFENSLLSTSQTYCSNTNYSEVLLENNENSLALIINNDKGDTADNYLTRVHGLPLFFNF